VSLWQNVGQKIEAATGSDRSLFNHSREILKQAFLFTKPFATHQRIYIPASAIGAVI